MIDKKVQKVYNKKEEDGNHEKMVSKANSDCYGSSLLTRRGSNWVFSRFSATTALDGRSGEYLHRGCLWVTAGV